MSDSNSLLIVDVDGLASWDAIELAEAIGPMVWGVRAHALLLATGMQITRSLKRYCKMLADVRASNSDELCALNAGGGVDAFTVAHKSHLDFIGVDQKLCGGLKLLSSEWQPSLVFSKYDGAVCITKNEHTGEIIDSWMVLTAEPSKLHMIVSWRVLASDDESVREFSVWKEVSSVVSNLLGSKLS